MDSHLKNYFRTISLFGSPVFRLLDQRSCITRVRVVRVCESILGLDTKGFRTCLLNWKENSLSRVFYSHSNFHYTFYKNQLLEKYYLKKSEILYQAAKTKLFDCLLTSPEHAQNYDLQGHKWSNQEMKLTNADLPWNPELAEIILGCI